MDAYKSVNLKIKGVGIQDGSKIKGYFKIIDKRLMGKAPNNRNADIVFSYLDQGHGYKTFLGFEFDTTTNVVSTSLDDVIITRNRNMNGYTIDVVEREHTENEQKFYRHLSGLFKEYLAEHLLTVQPITGGQGPNASLMKSLVGYPSEFIDEFVGKYKGDQAYLFDKITFDIKPSDWDVLRLLGKDQRAKHPDYSKFRRHDGIGAYAE